MMSPGISSQVENYRSQWLTTDFSFFQCSCVPQCVFRKLVSLIYPLPVENDSQTTRRDRYKSFQDASGAWRSGATQRRQERESRLKQWVQTAVNLWTAVASVLSLSRDFRLIYPFYWIFKSVFFPFWKINTIYLSIGMHKKYLIKNP